MQVLKSMTKDSHKTEANDTPDCKVNTTRLWLGFQE